MIGGEDFEIDKTPNPNDIEVLLHFFRFHWKAAVVSDSSGKRQDIRHANANRLFLNKQFVIYKDNISLARWDEEGYSDDLSDTAILVIIDDEALYLTYDCEKDTSKKLIEEIKTNIFHNSMLVRRVA